MLLKNKIKIKWYLIGTAINYFLFNYYINDPVLMFIFIAGIILNQIFLMRFGLYALGIEVNTTYIPTAIYGALKLLIIIAAFYCASRNSLNKELFWVGIYIFQLIIFSLSIKTTVKKN